MKKLLFLALLISSTIRFFAEGTPQIMPNPLVDIRLQVFDNNDAARNFMTYGCPATSRLNVRIKNVGNERIHIGIKQTDGDVYMRVRDPLGTIVYGPVLVNAAMGAAWINTYAQAVAGPSLVVGATGYNSLYFTPSLPGDFYIEFNPKNANTYIAGTSNVKRTFNFFDVSVENIPTKKLIKGRLWSNAWDFNCMSATNKFEAKMTIYAPDSVLTAIDFNGIQPWGFVILANSTGVSNTASITTDRKSVAGNKQYPEYKLFIQTPDTAVFVPGRIVPHLIGTPNISGCSLLGWKINLECSHNGLAEIYLNLNGVPGYQAGTADVFFNNRLVFGKNQITWNGNNGLGVPVADGTSIYMDVKYFAGLTHLPLYDVENHINGFKVAVIAPPGGNPSTFWDDSGLVPVGTTNLVAGCVNNCHPFTNRNAQTINTWWVTHYINTNVVSVKYNKCPPTANPDYQITALNTPITYSVVSNDVDPGGFPLSIGIVTPPLTGTASVVGGQISYTPQSGFSGTVSLVYQACNTPTLVLCDTAKYTIVIDCDDDGISSAIEPAGDSDGDGIQNRCDLDSDNDGITDKIEGYTDFDGDGIPNALDLDSDNDGIADAIEANSGVAPAGYDYTTGRIVGADTDGDGLLNSVDSAPNVGYGIGSTSTLLNPNTDGDSRANYLDRDSDNDGIMDLVECGGIDANRDGIIDGFTDTDANGYSDALLSAPLVVNNTDANGKVDYLDCDSDGDGISDNREGQTTAGYVAAAAFVDTDGDGIADQYDNGNGISPIDSNNDGVPDFRDTDSDNDGIIDKIEGNDAATTNGVADTAPLNADTDGDGIDDRFDSNVGTFSANTNVPCQDFDGDGIPDWRDTDDDGDGVPTAMETGDSVPANGIKDYLEVNACGNHFTGTSGYATSVFSNSGVTSPTNALNAPNSVDATLTSNGNNFVINFGTTYPIGSVIRILAQRSNGGNNNNPNGLQINQSTNGTVFSNTVVIPDGSFLQGIYSTFTYTTTVANIQYLRLARTGNRNLGIDAISITNCAPDQDNDGIPNSVDLDDDNDGLSDLQEGALDSDGDGLINSLDLDSDNDGIPDAIEANAGNLPANMNNQGQFSVAYVKANDSNLNGWVNIYDNFSGGANLQDQDFDGDGKPNRIDLDSDSDGIRDAVEANNGSLPANMNNAGQYPAAYAIANDSDGDGLVNAVDYSSGGVAILNPDTDADTNKDFLDLDSDGDTLLDGYEANNGSLPAGMNASGQYPPAYVAANDANGNGIVNALETTPLLNPDSDGNGKPDYLDKCLKSIANGNWNSSATWGGTIPTCGKCAMVSHTVTVTGQSYVSNVTILAGGLISNNTGTLNVCGNLAMSGGTVGTVGCNSKTILSGTINQKISGKWSFGTLELNNNAGATVVAAANVTVLKALILTKGTFSVAPTATFVLDGGSCGNAYVSGAGVGTFSGNATVASTIGGCQGYVSIGAPYNTTLAGINNLYYQGFTGAYGTNPLKWNNVYTYNEQKGGPSDSGYVAATNTSNVLVRGKGMVVYTFSNTVTPKIWSTGPISLANYTLPITYSTTSYGNLHDGFNLVANPYPAPIDWGTPASPGWTKVGCCDAIYSYNRCGNQFSAYVGGISVNGGSNIIPAYQGFWIKAHFPTSSITINRNAIVGTQKAVYKTAANTSTYSVLNAKIKTGIYEDELAIAFGDTAISNGLGSWYGACKMQTDIPNYPSFASWQTMPWDSYLMSINILPELKTKTIQLKTKTPKAGNYTITFSGLNTFDSNACIFLEDTLTGIYHDIRQDSVVDVTIGSVNYLSNRFILHFNAPPTIKTINPSCINSQSGLAIVASPYSNSTYTWKDANSNIVKQTNIIGYSTDSLSKVAAGKYIVEIQNNAVIAGACSSSSIEIVIPESNNTLNVNTVVTNPTMCNAINGTITTSITASNGACTYAWSNGATTPSVIVGDGTYQLQVTDVTGCMITKMISVTAPISNYANYTTSADTLIWPNATVSFTNTSFASTNYVWDFGDASTTSSNFNETHVFTATGTYNVSLTASTSNCSDTLVKQVVILSSTGVNEINDFTNSISIYPNPNNGEFIIDYLKGVSSTHQIIIMDILGKVVYSETILEHYKPFKASIKLHGFEEGVYILRISNKDVKKDLKLILNK